MKTLTDNDLKNIPGIGNDMEKHFFNIGIYTIDDLKNQNPEAMYERDCAVKGMHIDRCVLYIFRLAVYYAENSIHDTQKLKWWYWKDE